MKIKQILRLRFNKANPNKQGITNTFLAIGYLAKQGKVYNIPQNTIIQLLSKLNNDNPNTQDIANTFLALGYLAQKNGINKITSDSTVITKKITDHFFSQQNHKLIETKQLLEAHYRLHHFSNYTLISDQQLETIEAELMKNQPAPNKLQKSALILLNNANQNASIEALVCGYFVLQARFVS